MPRPTKDQTLAKIQTAVVTVVAARGIGATNVADIAKAAQISAGTIYLHYENKDDMLQQVYLAIKTAFHAALMRAADQPDSTTTLRALWMNLFEFLQTRPDDFLLLEYAGAAQVLTDAQKASVAPMQTEITALVRAAIDDGTIKPLPLSVIINLLIGPAMHLARVAVLSGTPPPRDEIDLTFDQVWQTLRA